MRRNALFLLLPIIGVFAFSSCEIEVDEQESDELLRLNAYMSIHYPDAKPTESGLYYIIEHEGDGATLSDEDFMLYDFTGRNLDDYVYETTDKSTAHLYDFYSPYIHYHPYYVAYQEKSDALPKGLIEGLSYMKEGGIAKLIMPSKLAYGAKRHEGMLPYSSIIMDVELKKVVKDPLAYEQELIDQFISENYPELSLENAFKDSIYILENSYTDSPFQQVTDSIEVGHTVTLYYTGTFLDSWVFDTNDKEIATENDIYNSSNSYDPLKVEVGGDAYIKGFSLALQNLVAPSNALVLIPSKFAYGAKGSGTIPAYTPLLFRLKIKGTVPAETDAETEE